MPDERTDVAMVFPNTYPSRENWEGSRVRVHGLAEHLSEMGLRVRVISVKDNRDDAPKATSGDYGNRPPENYYLGRSQPLGAHFLFFPPMLRMSSNEIVKRLRPRVLHLHLPVSLLGLPIDAGEAKVVADLHDLFFLREEFFKRDYRVPNFVARLLDATEFGLYDRADGLIATSESMKKRVSVAFNKKKKPVFVVKNGVDVSFFKPGERSRTTTSPLTIGFLGNQTTILGIEILLNALSLAKGKNLNVRFLLIGRPSETVMSWIRAHKLESLVRVTGFVPLESLPRTISEVDVGLSLRVRRTTGDHAEDLGDYYQPTKMLEFMACGIPCVSTPLREPSRILNEAGSGFVMDEFSGSSLLDCIESATSLGRPTLEEIGLKGRSYVEKNHSWDVVARSALEAYRGLSAAL